MLDESLFDRRSFNNLRRRKCATWGDLAALSVGDIWMIPNAGRITVERVLSVSREMASRFSVDENEMGDWWLSAKDGAADGELQSVPVVQRTAEQDFVSSFIGTLMSWAIDAHGASTIGEVLAALDSPMPSDLSDELARASELQIIDVVPHLDTVPDASGLIDDFLRSVGPDVRFVIQRHIVGPCGRMPTLESVAEVEGLTRERIRQRIKRGLVQAEQLRGVDKYRLLNWRAEELARVMGSACPINAPSVTSAINEAIRGFDDPDGCLASEFMLWFAGEYRERDGFWVSGEVGQLQTILSSVRVTLEGEWLLTRDKLLEMVAGVGILVDLNDADVEMVSGWRCIGDGWWIRWDGSLGDKAERVLRLALRALGPAEMNELIGDGHANSSIQNVLSSDDRFTRVSMDLQFALTCWGWEEYSSAAQEIAERVERAGGEAVLADVIIELVNQFGLKESTVRAYASTPAFVVYDGKIRLRREHEPVEVNDRVMSAAGLYVRADDSVIYHLQVDADVLRGSGRSIPNPLSVAVGVRPGGFREFSAGTLGPIRITWPSTAVTGAAIGSTRAIAEHYDAKLGDTLRLVFDLQVATVTGAVVTGSSLEELTGLPLSPGGELDQLSASLRVAPNEVRAALVDRGDERIASLLPLSGPSRGFDEAFSELDALLG